MMWIKLRKFNAKSIDINLNKEYLNFKNIKLEKYYDYGEVKSLKRICGAG